MGDYKLVLIDLDGTLLNSSYKISNYTKDVLKKVNEKGVEIFISTGRHYKDALNIKKEIGLNEGFVISSNGGEIHDSNSNLIYSRLLDEDVVNHLIERGYDAEAIHGDISQHQREKTLTRFKNKTINLLIATDVAARGIDVGNLTHVVNYSLPQEAEAYVHRIGRTGRAGNEGVAITFVTPRESRKLMQIQRVAKAEIKKKDIPQVAEIIEAKKESLHAFVNEIIEEKDHQSYIDFAKELTINHDPIEVLSAILRHTYDEEFEASSYKDIKDVNIKFDEKTRLFVGMGRKDNLTPKKLLEMVYKEAHVKGRKIREIRIMNDFSFMTMPFVEAEKVIEAYKRQKRRGKPLIERAKR